MKISFRKQSKNKHKVMIKLAKYKLHLFVVAFLQTQKKFEKL